MYNHHREKMTSQIATTDDVLVKTKLKQLLKDTDFTDEIDSRFCFLFDKDRSKQLQALQQSEAVELTMEEGKPLFACNINHQVGEVFLDVYGTLTNMYIRDGYDMLLEDILRLWKDPTTKEVILLGNAGSGKSWYQLYVIRLLLRLKLNTSKNDIDDDYDFIFRQVGKEMYLIDLKECIGYEVSSWHRSTMKKLRRCLFFYEPGTEKDLAPDHYGIPSLLTLSPYKRRISEYLKGPSVELYFWPWSFNELKTMIEHSNVEKEDEKKIRFEELFENYTYFGGIVRCHFLTATRKQRALSDLEGRLLRMDLAVLQSKAMDIDRDSSGDNVSGYILCYDGKRQALELKNDPQRTTLTCFHVKCLKYTSAYVAEKAGELLQKEPLKKKMQVVLDRLNDRAVDLSGKNLEAVATEFLRAGQQFKWKVKRAGVGDWTAFQTKKRKVTREYNISELLTKADELLVPTNTSFPVADMVFSGWGRNKTYVFQCTWQPSHPFTVRALYELRMKYLKVDATQTVLIIMVVPGQETKYSEMPEDKFLEGPTDQPLQYSSSEIVQAEELKQMWSNTEVHVLRPLVDWKELISDWLLQPNQDISSMEE